MAEWHARGRELLQRHGLDPRYVRRLRWISKARALGDVGAPVLPNLGYVLLDPEPHNYTYALANRSELIDFAASASATPREAIAGYHAELENDAELRERLRAATRGHWWWSKPLPEFGRRAAWYLLARALKPALSIETGVHDGLGSLVILRALERNAAEGTAGHLISFDINPAAGWLVGEHPQWSLRIEATREGLPPVLEERPPLGLFIHDSWHSYENEFFELSAAAKTLTAAGVLVSDNAHVTTALRDLCAQRGLDYIEFREEPAGHFYPGSVMAAGRSRRRRER